MILAQELRTIDSEIAQLQALIEAKRQRAEVLTSAENLASEALSRLNQAVSRIGEVAPGAIASLKTAVLTLFADGDGSNDGGNQPLVSGDSDEAEQPQNFTPGSIIVDEAGSIGVVIGGNNQGMRVDWLGLGDCPNPASGKGVWYNWEKDNHALASLKPATHDQIKLFSTSEFLQFQEWDEEQLDEYWDGKWVSDYGYEYRWGGATIDRWIVVFAQSCEWASPFASHLTCLLWEDAPLTGQHCAVTLEDNKNKGTKSGEAMPFVELVKVTDAIAYQKKSLTGEIVCCYVGFRTKAHAQSWLHFFEATTSKVELRQAKRLEHKWEIKVKGLSIKQIERYAKECDFTSSYRTEVCSSLPPSYKKPEPPQPVNPDEIAPGDIVVGLLTPSSSYRIIQIMPNGILDCENLTTGDRLGLRATAVSLVQKGAAVTATDIDLDF